MLISAIRKFFRELSNSPILNGNSREEESKKIFILKNITVLKFMSAFMVFLLTFFSLFSLYNKNYLITIIDLTAAVIMVLILLHMNKTQNHAIASKSLILYMMVLTMFFFQFGESENGLSLWFLTAPLFLIFFLRIREGTIISMIFLSLNIFLNQLHIFPSVYSGTFLIRYSGVFITIVLMSHIYGRIQERSQIGLENINLSYDKNIKKLSATKKELQQSEEQYRALVENSNDGIGILRDFKFIYINSKLSKMTGFDKEELLEKSLEQVLISKHPELINRLFNKETWSGLPRERVELNILTKSGEYNEVEVGTNTVEYENTSSQLIFIRDVKERNLAEKERSKISNLESFRVVANGVTHDFNNILTIILGNLELIRLAGKDKPKLEKPISKIEEASARAAELLDDLYIFSTSSVKEESIEFISEIIDSVLYTLKTEFSSTEIILNSKNDILKLRCDRKQVSIALKNILLNSLDAAEGKSKIEISITGFSNLANIVQPLRRGEYLKISIKDSGKGIPAENIGKIFDPYFSTKGNVTEKGMGLGLAIANKIILDHMGLITVTSKDGKGTTFIIYLPVEVDYSGNS